MENGINYFESQLFMKEIKPKFQKILEETENKNNKIKLLKDKLKCSICNYKVTNPMYDPTSCDHMSCKNCLELYLRKNNISQCPRCKKIIKKDKLVKIPIIDSINEKLIEMDNIDDTLQYEKIEQKCELHPKNAIFFLCLDCNKKMCPLCIEEKKKHDNHHLVNYERYIILFNYFQNNFSKFYEKISEKENNIEEYINLILLLEKQKNIYTNFFNDFSIKIQELYSKNQEKINQIIEESKQTILNLRNFMRNLKLDISIRFKNSYNDIEDIDELKKEIKEKVDKFEYKENNKNEILHFKNKYINNTFQLPKIQIMTTLNKKALLDNSHLNNKIDEQGNYSFGFELSDDKKSIKTYLDINKIINGQQNEKPYIPFIEYGKTNKLLYLEPVEIEENQISFENTLSLEEIFGDNENNVDIKLTVLYLNI